ncbi:MAG: hypothetical protein AAF191_08900 [Verrucomicrobiota bacterium]
MTPDNLGPCQEISGLLFKRPCSKAGIHFCVQCRNVVCGRHARERPSDEQIYCLSCSRTWIRDESVAYDSDKARDDHQHDQDRPGYYHEGYWKTHHRDHDDRDPQDFTEADSAPLQTEGHDVFEQDPSES